MRIENIITFFLFFFVSINSLILKLKRFYKIEFLHKKFDIIMKNYLIIFFFKIILKLNSLIFVWWHSASK